MFESVTPRFMVTVACALVLLAPLLGRAQNLADRDAKEVADYVLTDAALARYTKAVHKLEPLLGELSQDCEGEEDQRSLNDAAARMDRHPGVKAALNAVGMTSREYLLFSWSVFQNGMAAWALDQPGGALPSGVKMENVKFYRAHETDLKKLGELAKPADCDNRNR